MIGESELQVACHFFATSTQYLLSRKPIGQLHQTVHGEVTQLRLISTTGEFFALVQNPGFRTDTERCCVYRVRPRKSYSFSDHFGLEVTSPFIFPKGSQGTLQ